MVVLSQWDAGNQLLALVRRTSGRAQPMGCWQPIVSTRKEDQWSCSANGMMATNCSHSMSSFLLSWLHYRNFCKLHIGMRMDECVKQFIYSIWFM